MNIIRYPNRSDWAFILKRSALKTDSLQDTVREILDKVRTEGDKAVKEYEEKFDHVQLDSLRVTEEEFEEAEKEVGIELKAAIIPRRTEVRRQEDTDPAGSYLLAEVSSHRESGLIRSRRNSSFILYSADACHSCTDSRM